jgi:hypothetical protein
MIHAEKNVTEVRLFAPGGVIHPGEMMYAVQRGLVRIERSGQALAVLSAGGHRNRRDRMCADST